MIWFKEEIWLCVDNDLFFYLQGLLIHHNSVSISVRYYICGSLMIFYHFFIFTGSSILLGWLLDTKCYWVFARSLCYWIARKYFSKVVSSEKLNFPIHSCAVATCVVTSSLRISLVSYHLLLTCFPCNKSSIDSFMNVWLPRHACHNCMHMWACHRLGNTLWRLN